MSIFYNSCSGFVNEFHNVILCIAEVIVIISVIVHGNDFAVSVIAEAENSCAAARTDSHAYQKAAVVIIVRYGAV